MPLTDDDIKTNGRVYARRLKACGDETLVAIGEALETIMRAIEVDTRNEDEIFALAERVCDGGDL